MPLKNGEYVKLTADEIRRRLENSLDEQLDTGAQAGDLVTKQLQAEAETLAQNQEQALERVHRAAYLADATGRELDKVVDIIGLTRMEASPSTGTVLFSRETPPTTTYPIPNGSQVQTGGPTPIQFETTEQDALTYIDGFESGDLTKWIGDTADFSVVDTSKLTGNHALEVPAVDGVNVTSNDKSFGVGTTYTLNILPNDGSVTGFRFGIQDQSNYLEVIVDENAQDLKLRVIEDGAEAALSLNDSASIPAGSESYLEVNWSLYQETTATLYETENRDVELCTVSIEGLPEWDAGPVNVASLDATSTALVDEVSTREALVNVRAVDTGVETNLGPNTITTIADAITGVEDVNNPVATGKPTLENTDYEPFLLGEEREDDEELRDRAFNSTSIGGSATVNALRTELQRVDGVRALTLNRNRKDVAVNGLPSHSFEAIVYGGTDEAVANAIFNTASIDSHDVGGINGTKTTYTVTSNVTNDSETISWSRPNRLNLNITLDLVVDDTYVGDTAIQDRIVNYIGGTGLEGNFINGLAVGEDIYEAVLKRKIVAPEETGVWEVNSLSIDANGDGTNDIETTASGAEILAVSDSSVAVTNARDGSITITKTQK